MKLRVIAAAAVASCLVLSPVQVSAHGGAKGVVKQRMDQMEEMKDEVKSISAMLKGRSVYSREAMEAGVKRIQARSGDALLQLFPEGSLTKPSEALPEIWQQWPEFEQLANKQQALSEALLEAVSAASGEKADKDVMQAFKALSSNCKQCHDQFRIEE